MKQLSLTFILLMILIGDSIGQSKYLAQPVPGEAPELFAPSMVNTDSVELNAVFNADMTEFFFTRIINGSFIIHHSELVDGEWTDPAPIQMFADTKTTSTAVDMTITMDGQTMYFLGVAPEKQGSLSSADIYMSQKVNGKWQLATRVGHPISTDEYSEFYPVVVADGSLYFVSNRPGGYGNRDIYRAQYLGNGKFDSPVSLGPIVNSKDGSGDTYVSPDERFLICNTTRDGKNSIHVAFKKKGEWQAPIDLGEPINSQWTDFCPYMSPDGKYFFFSRRYSDPPGSGWSGVVKGEVYWMDARAILKKRKKN